MVSEIFHGFEEVKALLSSMLDETGQFANLDAVTNEISTDIVNSVKGVAASLKGLGGVCFVVFCLVFDSFF